jgi:hypothetical protein
MRRFQFIEFHEQAWFPSSIRDEITDALQFGLKLAQAYAPIAPMLERAIGAIRARSIIDLCSGGGPWLDLSPKLHGDTPAISIQLSDEYPNLRAFQNVKAASENHICSDSASVDAMKVPRELTGFRTMFTSFPSFSAARRASDPAGRRRRRPKHRHIRSHPARSTDNRLHVCLGSFSIRLHAVDSPLPLVAPALDLRRSHNSRRPAFRWHRLLPAHLAPAGAARDHRKTHRHEVPLGIGRTRRSPRRDAHHLPDRLPHHRRCGISGTEPAKFSAPKLRRYVPPRSSPSADRSALRPAPLPPAASA